MYVNWLADEDANSAFETPLAHGALWMGFIRGAISLLFFFRGRAKAAAGEEEEDDDIRFNLF